MRHATILDAFNEASRFTHQTLGVLTKEKEYELDTELYTQSINLAALQNKLILDYTRIDEQGQMFRQNADEYQKHVDAELDNFFRDAREAGRQYSVRSLGQNLKDFITGALPDKEPSRYYTEKLRQLEAQGRLAMGQRYKEAAVKNEQENKEVAYNRLRTAQQNNGAGIVDQMNAYDDQVQVNRKDAVTEFQGRSGLYTQGYKDAVAPGNIGNLTFDQLKTQINDREAQFFKDAETVLNGKSLDEYIQGMKGIKDTALQAAQQAVWSRDFANGRLENEKFENAARMANKENPSQVAAILDWQRRIVQEKNRLLKNGNYNPGDNSGPQIARWGELPAGWDTGGRSTGGGQGEKAPKKANLTDVRADLELLFDDKLRGEMPGATVQSMKKDIVSELLAMSRERHGYEGKSEDPKIETQAVIDFEAQIQPVLNDYFKIFKDRYDTDPKRKAVTDKIEHWFSVNGTNKSWLERNYRGYAEYFKGQLLSFQLDTVTSMENIDPDVVMRRLDDYMAALRGEGLDMIAKKHTYDKTSDLAKALNQRDSNTNIMYSDVEGKKITLSGPPGGKDYDLVQKNLEAINKAEASVIESAFGLETGRLIPLNKQPDAYEVDAETYFKYGESGPFYRVKGSADGTLTVQKADRENGSWGNDKVISGGNTGNGGFFGRIISRAQAAASTAESVGRRVFGSDELRDAERASAGRTEDAARFISQASEALGTNGKPFPVPGFTETNTSSHGYFDRRRIVLENYVRENGTEAYLKWLRENHNGILPEEWKK